MNLGGEQPVWAAGAVPQRGLGSEREVLLVHRPAYDDWSLPKGKAHSDELLPTTAIREVGEESAVQLRLGANLTPQRYPIGSAMKIVSWWVGVTLASGSHAPDSEVDKVRWMSPAEAEQTLTYCNERTVLAEAMALPDTTPLVIVRHAKALRRETWKKNDARRPLSNRGHQQLPYLTQILKPFGVRNLVSSSSTRCQETLAEYATLIKATIKTEPLLSEEQATDQAVGVYMTRLARAVGASGTPTVVCGHRPVIPAMLAPLGIPNHPLATASCVIAHLDARGTVVRTEWHDTLRAKQ